MNLISQKSKFLVDELLKLVNSEAFDLTTYQMLIEKTMLDVVTVTETNIKQNLPKPD